MRDLNCKLWANPREIESLILDACHNNRQRFSLYTPEFTVTFDPVGKDVHRAIVTDERQKVAATAIVDKFDV